MRRLGEARAARHILVPRTPAEPLAEALLLVSLALLLPGPAGAAAIEDGPQAPPFTLPPGITRAIAPETAGTPAAGGPAYAPYAVVDQAVEAAGRASCPRGSLKGLVNGALRVSCATATLLPQLARQIEAHWNHPQLVGGQAALGLSRQRRESILAAANVPRR